MEITKIPSFTIIATESNQYSFYPQINVGNYLSFRATREASINSYEFFSDVLKKDFQVYEMNKKGKITYTSEVYKYDHSDFFNAYQKGVESDRAEAREVGITLAGVKKNNSEYEEFAAGTVVAIEKEFGAVIKCGKGSVILTKVKPENKNVINGKDFVNGNYIKTGDKLGLQEE